jgi:hypothetical protein
VGLCFPLKITVFIPSGNLKHATGFRTFFHFPPQLLERSKAVVAVFPGIVTVNVLVQVLSEPKSKTAIDLFALLAL